MKIPPNIITVRKTPELTRSRGLAAGNIFVALIMNPKDQPKERPWICDRHRPGKLGYYRITTTRKFASLPCGQSRTQTIECLTRMPDEIKDSDRIQWPDTTNRGIRFGLRMSEWRTTSCSQQKERIWFDFVGHARKTSKGLGTRLPCGHLGFWVSGYRHKMTNSKAVLIAHLHDNVNNWPRNSMLSLHSYWYKLSSMDFRNKNCAHENRTCTRGEILSRLPPSLWPWRRTLTNSSDIKYIFPWYHRSHPHHHIHHHHIHTTTSTPPHPQTRSLWQSANARNVSYCLFHGVYYPHQLIHQFVFRRPDAVT